MLPSLISIDGIVVAKEWEGPLLEAWEQDREVVNEKQQQVMTTPTVLTSY